MYYAAFKDVLDSDIAGFNSKKERDDWVNFKDKFSLAFRETPENAVFQRVALDGSVAKKLIKEMLHTMDEFNDGQHWYYFRYWVSDEI